MALQITTNIDVDFYDKKYILVNAKQLDKNSRLISVSCYYRGEIYPINYSEHAAYIRYKKADDYSVFNFCTITDNGKVLIELTEQMLAADGICYADLVIVNRGNAKIDTETGKIVTIDNASILSTMTFCIDVSETAAENSEIESTHEFNLLNTKLEEYWADYEDVMQTAKSYAVGNAGGIRENEDADNAKYYYEQSLNNANNASNSELNASKSEQNAKASESNASNSENSAKTSANNAKTYMDNAEEYMSNAKESEDNASDSENNAANSAAAALASEQKAKESENIAVSSALSASVSEQNANNSETSAKESETNAYNYYEMVKSVADGLNSGFIPMGTISFSELETAEKATGFTYNIRDDFVTNETFREGSGLSYTAGTNVYYTADGYWDCFGGSASSSATVDEVKEYLGI